MAELVLALGVLAIGLTMAAALFPAAMKLTEQSTRDTVGTLVAANGLAVARSLLRPSDIPPGDDLYDLTGTDAFADQAWLLRYPSDPSAEPTGRGCAVLGRKLPQGTQQLVIAAYDTASPDNPVAIRRPTITGVSAPGGASALHLNADAGPRLIGATILVPIPHTSTTLPPSAILYARITDYSAPDMVVLEHGLGNVQGLGAIIVDGATRPMPVTILVAEVSLAWFRRPTDPD